MRAEDLISMANAHGVDLMRVAKNMTSDDPAVMAAARDVVRKRFAAGRTALVLVEPSGSPARGKETRSAKRPEWTAAELAQASAGIDELHFRAALYAYAGDRKWYKWLFEQLRDEAFNLRDERQWPTALPDRFHPQLEVYYLPLLAAMVLDEDAYPSVFKVSPPLYPIYMRVSDKDWSRSVEGPFNVLKNVWVNWATEALRMIQPRLRQHEETV